MHHRHPGELRPATPSSTSCGVRQPEERRSIPYPNSLPYGPVGPDSCSGVGEQWVHRPVRDKRKVNERGAGLSPDLMSSGCSGDDPKKDRRLVGGSPAITSSGGPRS